MQRFTEMGVSLGQLMSESGTGKVRKLNRLTGCLLTLTIGSGRFTKAKISRKQKKMYESSCVESHALSQPIKTLLRLKSRTPITTLSCLFYDVYNIEDIVH